MRTVEQIVREEKTEILPYDQSGWMNNASAFLKILVSKPDIKNIIEVGSFTGSQSTQLFGSFAKARGGRLLAVDLFVMDAGLKSWCAICGFTFPFDKLWEQFLSNIMHTNIADVTIPFKCNSNEFFFSCEVLSQEERDEYDLIYIDGDHGGHQVKKDVDNALRLFPKAILIGDDWATPSLDVHVQPAVNEMAVKYNKQVVIDGNLWRLV
jgi:predicted O-methyltransferase YrrM